VGLYSTREGVISKSREASGLVDRQGLVESTEVAKGKRKVQWVDGRQLHIDEGEMCLVYAYIRGAPATQASVFLPSVVLHILFQEMENIWWSPNFEQALVDIVITRTRARVGERGMKE
jgi:hypothetical protein